MIEMLQHDAFGDIIEAMITPTTSDLTSDDALDAWMLENGKWEQAVRAYHASVSFADDMIGRLLAALENGPLAGQSCAATGWGENV